MVADRIGESHDIQPADGHPLAVMRRREQLFDQPLVGLRVGIGYEGIYLFGLRRQTVRRRPSVARPAPSPPGPAAGRQGCLGRKPEGSRKTKTLGSVGRCQGGVAVTPWSPWRV